MGVAAFIYNGLSHVFFPYTIDYAEGPIIEQVAKLSRGENIYPADLSEPPYMVSVYSPLFMLLQVPFYWLAGEPALWYGRLLSFVSTLAAAGAIYLIVARLADRPQALLSAGLFLSMPFVMFWGSLNKVDALGLALSLAGLALLLYRPAAAAAGLLMLLAVYTRQTYALAGPLAGAVYLAAARRWQALIEFVVVLAVGGLVLFAIANSATGGGFWLNVIVANLNPWHLPTLLTFYRDLWITLPVLLIIGGGYLWRGDQIIVKVYLVAAALASLSIGKIGSNSNYFLELCAALAISAGLVLYRVRDLELRWSTSLEIVAGLVLYRVRAAESRWSTALALALALNGLWFVPWWVVMKQNLAQIERVETRLTDIIQATDGWVLVDQQMGALALLGREIYIEPFVTAQLAAAGRWDQRRFLNDLEQRKFALLIITSQDAPGHNLIAQRWTDNAWAAMNEFYRLEQVIVSPKAKSLIYKPN